jgi:hypothetical protein
LNQLDGVLAVMAVTLAGDFIHQVSG